MLNVLLQRKPSRCKGTDRSKATNVFFHFLPLVVQDPFCSYYSLPIVVTYNFNLLTFITKLNSGKFLVLGHDFCRIQAVSPFRRSPWRD